MACFHHPAPEAGARQAIRLVSVRGNPGCCLRAVEQSFGPPLRARPLHLEHHPQQPDGYSGDGRRKDRDHLLISSPLSRIGWHLCAAPGGYPQHTQTAAQVQGWTRQSGLQYLSAMSGAPGRSWWPRFNFSGGPATTHDLFSPSHARAGSGSSTCAATGCCRVLRRSLVARLYGRSPST